MFFTHMYDVSLENFNFIFKLGWQLLSELRASPCAKLLPTHEVSTPPTEMTKSDGFLSANSGVFINFSSLIRLAMQVKIKPYKRDFSIQVAGLSSNPGYNSERSRAAILPFGISDESFCFFL